MSKSPRGEDQRIRWKPSRRRETGAHRACSSPTWKLLRRTLACVLGRQLSGPVLQVLIGTDSITSLHKLEQVSSDEGIGTLAENLLRLWSTRMNRKIDAPAGDPG